MKQISFSRKSSAPCGICHNPTHRGYLVAKAIKEHDCIVKNCKYLQKLDHDYWRQRERKRLEKKAMKLYGQLNPRWRKDDCYQAVKMLRIEDLRGFLEVNGIELPND